MFALFANWRYSKFLVTVDNILWLSSSRIEHLFILLSIARDSAKQSYSSCFSFPSL